MDESTRQRWARARPATAHLFDAHKRLGLEVRLGPAGLDPAIQDSHAIGVAAPVRLTGHVDELLRACAEAQPGEVLVLDNRGRLDEGCFGDLAVVEAMGSGAVGIVAWGAHRDGLEVRELGLPVFTLGTAVGGMWTEEPRDPEAFERCWLGEVEVKRGDIVVADTDGAIIIDPEHAEAVLRTAAEIAHIERMQLELVRRGTPLSEQVDLPGFNAALADDPTLTLGRWMASRDQNL